MLRVIDGGHTVYVTRREPVEVATRIEDTEGRFFTIAGAIALDTNDITFPWARAFSRDDPLTLAEHLGLLDQVIEVVADQIFDGRTKNGRYAARSIGAKAEPTTALDRAIRRTTTEVAEREIRALTDANIKLANRLADSEYELEKMRRHNQSLIAEIRRLMT